MATVLALLATAILSLVLIGGDTVQATSFNPVATADLADTAPGVNSNLETTLALSAPDSNFGALINFTPPEFFVAADLDVPDGASALFLKSQATLGLINGPCAPAGLAPEFNMMDATADINGPTVGFNDTDDPGSLGEIFEDDNGDTIPNGAQMYPDFLINTFKDTNGQTIKPRARLYGQTVVVGIDVSLNFVIFEPGTTFVSPTTGNVFRTDPALGYPSVTILQNLSDPEAVPEPSPITDFCTPLTTQVTTFGMAGGAEYRRNPDADGTYNFVLFAASIPDADSDGFENNFDTCPYDVNLDGDPRGGADPEGAGEGIDSACDNDPGTGQIGVGVCGPGPADDFLASDCDADGFSNRGDNCPQVANGPQQDNQRDIDGDTIGDACDKNNGAIDGHVHILCVVSPVTVGAGGGAPAQDQYICEQNVVCLDLDRNGTCDMDEGGGGGQPTPTPGPGNQAPTCGGVEVTAFADTTTPSFSLNCSDTDGDSLTCSVVADGSKGSVSITNCESATYTSKSGESGTDSFTYKANDGELDSNTATGNVTILTDADGDGVVDVDDQCPDTPGDEEVDPSGCSEAQLAAAVEEEKESLLEELGEELSEGEVGLALGASIDTVIALGSTGIVVSCQEKENGLKPVPGVDVTFKIDSQPGSDASLEDETATTDAEGNAVVTLNVGSTAGEIVVSASGVGCGDAKTVTVTVKEATVAGGTGDTEVAGAGTGPSGTGTGGGTGAAGGAATGVGALAPIASSIPVWAAILSALGGAGLLGSLGAIASRILRRRR